MWGNMPCLRDVSHEEHSLEIAVWDKQRDEGFKAGNILLLHHQGGKAFGFVFLVVSTVMKPF